jgi:FkbM family methyltransferase
MDITQVKQSGFNWNIRLANGFEDLKVVHEVIAMDSYNLNELADCIDPKFILDIGGHIGSFGVFAKSKWPDAQLIAVEPCKESAQLYRKNLKSNGLNKKSVVINAGVSYDKNRTCLVHSPGTTGGHLLRSKLDAEIYTTESYRGYSGIDDYKVKTITIEEICEKYKIDEIGLAKWDCEGGEVDAFINMDADTRRKFQFMVGEYHLWNDDTKYLKCPKSFCYSFWRDVKRNFRHLNWNYKENRLGLFQAWPKAG